MFKFFLDQRSCEICQSSFEINFGFDQTVHSSDLIENEQSTSIDQIVDDDHSLNNNSYIDYNSNIRPRLAAEYEGLDLTSKTQYYVDNKDLAKLNPHTAMRRELLSLIFDDVSKSHKILSVINLNASFLVLTFTIF